MMYKGYDIIPVTESYLKNYGSVMFSIGDKPADFAKDVDDAKRKIDDELWEEEKRYTS